MVLLQGVFCKSQSLLQKPKTVQSERLFTAAMEMEPLIMVSQFLLAETYG